MISRPSGEHADQPGSPEEKVQVRGMSQDTPE